MPRNAGCGAEPDGVLLERVGNEQQALLQANRPGVGDALEGEGQAFIRKNPGSSASRRAIERIIEFAHKQAG
ncbi:MAG: hypothetical protein HY726_12860 [Candidatus Rokubacteria bacterium]|nr:hypothetical protein [Candidatus Rokubacteria bacterium]